MTDPETDSLKLENRRANPFGASERLVVVRYQTLTVR